MKVLINAISARLGGGQTYLRHLLNYLPVGDQIEIFVVAPESLKLPSYSHLKRLEIPKSVENPLIRIFWEKFYLPKLLKSLNVDILFSPGGIIGTNPQDGCKTVTMFRNMLPFDHESRAKYPLGYMRLRTWLLEQMLLKSMVQADLVIFVSEFARNVIKKKTRGLLKENVVIPHGLDSSFKAAGFQALSRPKWLPKRDYFLYVSILDVYKAQIEVVQAYALLKKDRSTEEILILAGPEYPPYAKKVRLEITRLGLQNDILLTGPIPYDQLPALYHHAKINIFASECENCPNILLEALGAGKPVFVSQRPPMPEFGGDAVIYFDPLSPSDLANKIKSIIDNPIEMNQMARKARERSVYFNWEDTAKKTWETISNLYHAGKEA